ncbi:hypothetical protein BDP27DRAFT_1425872 [Rhodocollybia butyracea]|uniref:Uncharacterized protein n=1 Tax=Rhodocollybia butyracea TaxID=206335 RepID=A0A9P5U454_9AGAR|nr:hypothetical protein BDP27DRAFT_1425872 [Rhodocollybia butyracea]
MPPAKAKPSASKARMPASKAKTPATKEKTAKEEPKIRVQKLSHLYRLIFWLPKLVQPDPICDEDRNVIEASTPLSRAIEESRVIPFWIEACPDNLKEKWGQRWTYIHQKLAKMSRKVTKKSVNNFDWRKLEDVLNLARKEKWVACVDKYLQILKHLDNENLSIQAFYKHNSNYAKVFENNQNRAVGFVSLTNWDTMLYHLLPAMQFSHPHIWSY